MSLQPDSLEKVCVLCGEDCSRRPRTKDRKGRYYCRSCYETALRRQRAGKPVHAAKNLPPPPQEDGLNLDDKFDPFADVVAPARSGPVTAKPGPQCPGCGAELASGALVCANCGYHKTSGRRVTPRAVHSGAKPARLRGLSFGGMPDVVKGPWMAFVGPAAVFVVLFLLAKGTEDWAALYVGVWWLCAITVNILVLYQAFRAGVVAGVLCLLFWPYALYFVFLKMESPRTKNSYLALILGAILMYLGPAGMHGVNSVLAPVEGEYLEPAEEDTEEFSWAVPESFADDPAWLPTLGRVGQMHLLRI
ncbi:MAG: hypothetical protein JSW71_05780 [Gemmatimonadota bacterium]|nr:MAG: hypothetical protein JSW71_05780 [Gemmatimonadota bacterium]